MIFVNLPIDSVKRSEDFFTRLGFEFNREFCDEQTLCVTVADNIFVMLLERPFFKTFVDTEISDAHRATEVLNCLTAGSREEIDEMLRTAVAAGGSVCKEPTELGGMYGGSFRDPDGHVWELIHSDQAAA